MADLFTDFHFLRPWWLLALVPALLLTLFIWRRQAVERTWRGIVAEHLLTHLLVGTERQGRVKPLYLLLAVWTIGTIAVAGPAWRLEPSPFTEDAAALVIVVKVAPSMDAKDIQPSRLERAAHKIKDLLALRPGARNALIAFAGSAHLVMPMTQDARIIETFAMELSPEIMPVEGDAVGEALSLADDQLRTSGQPGSILLITDSIPGNQLQALEAHRKNRGSPVHILAVAADEGVPVPSDSPPAPALDRKAMEQAADAVDGTLMVVSVDDRDVRRLTDQIERSFVAAPQTDGGQRWKDEGYLLVPFITLLSLMWFRPGWIVKYQ
jgi:Ca-activated chloride channel family protein